MAQPPQRKAPYEEHPPGKGYAILLNYWGGTTGSIAWCIACMCPFVPLQMVTVAEVKVASRGLVDGKALDIVKVVEKNDGFETWRRDFAE